MISYAKRTSADVFQGSTNRFCSPASSRQGISGKCVARRIHVYALMHIDSNSVHPAKAPPAAKFAMADELGDEEGFGGMQVSSK